MHYYILHVCTTVSWHHFCCMFFRFVISNGKTSRNGSVDIIVEMVDRVLPSLASNKGLTIPQGSAMILGPDCLSLSDPDTPPSALTFVLHQPPQYGSLCLAGITLTAGSNFTQRDIKELKLTYKHNGGPSQIDCFTFTASDSSSRGFLLDEQLQTEPVVFTVQVGAHECSLSYCIIPSCVIVLLETSHCVISLSDTFYVIFHQKSNFWWSLSKLGVISDQAFGKVTSWN